MFSLLPESATKRPFWHSAGHLSGNPEVAASFDMFRSGRDYLPVYR